MQQWLAEIAYDTTSGTKRKTETFYLPTIDDVREAVHKRGAYVLKVRPYQRSTVERYIAKSPWWQIQLLRGIHFRSTNSSPSIALWQLIDAETNPTRQNILAPAREALSQGLGAIDALKSLNIFDHGTLAILSASERANKLSEGIPHAIESIVQRRKNARALTGTILWLSALLFIVTKIIFWGGSLVPDWFAQNTPANPQDLAQYNQALEQLQQIWNLLIIPSLMFGGFMFWCIFSFWYNRGRADFPTAKIVRRIPLIGPYLRDLGFSDSMSAAARMIRGHVPIADTLKIASQSTNSPDVSRYWLSCLEDLNRGLSLGATLDREPLNRVERMELSSLSDLHQVATVMENISEMRLGMSKTKHSLIIWVALALSGLYLFTAFSSALTLAYVDGDTIGRLEAFFGSLSHAFFGGTI